MSVKSESKGTILITLSRSGGGFTLNCLSKHPWVIAEAFFGWYKAVGMGKIDERKVLLDALLHRPGFKASVVKVMEPQLFPLSFWREMDVSVIYQERRNILRCAAAAMAKWHAKEGKSMPWTFPPDEFMALLDQREEDLRVVREYVDDMEMDGFRVLRIFYRDIVGGEANTAEQIDPDVARDICDFLGIEYEPLWSPMTRNHPWPLRKMVANWDDVRPLVAASEYAEWLEEEALYG